MATAYLTPGVYMEEVESGSKPIEGVGTAVAAFVGFAEKGPIGQPTLVTNWSQFQQNFGGFIEGGYLGTAVYGYFNNGGGLAYITRLPGEVRQTSENGTAAKALPAGKLALPTKGNKDLSSLEFTANEGVAEANDVTFEVKADEGAPEDQFTLTIKSGGATESFPNVTLNKGKGARNVVEVVNKESKLVKVAEKETAGSLAERTPAAGTYALAKAAPASLATRSALPKVSTVEFIGDAAARTGILGLEVADIVTMLAVPDVWAAYQAGMLTMDGVKAVQTAMLDHCAAMKDRVAIIDCPPDMNPQQIREWRQVTAGYDSKYAAMYYPWVQVANPKGGDPIMVPPSGHMAGLWARVDGERGVHKAPANEIVRGALGLEVQVTKGEQETLNPIGVNCIRSFPGRGIRVWGARTLSSDPSWRYLNVRRLFNFVEKSIENGTQWTVFEPNDMDLWERVKRNITAFLSRVWASGALFGATPSEAFFVKCDAELNPEEVRDAGQLIVEIGIAPVKPAEFVIFRVSQYSASGG